MKVKELKKLLENVDDQPKLLYKWPVLEPIKLISPLVNIPGKQRIWKIKF
ncbi:MAG: hypothetical protein K5893_12760 [Prevotella sp.]|nr:hypothetical protein [Prevotella sp.]